jgi:carbonic anhydrase/acetyltransferase-like protein (isoleucine patch superfamily)
MFVSPIRKFDNKIPHIASSAYIDSSAVIIGEVSIGEESSVWPYCVIRGDIQAITIGKRSNIQDGSIIHVTHAGPFNAKGHSVVIGNDVIIGHQVVLHGCKINDNSLIGIGSRVMDDAEIESNVIIGAGSLVPPGKKVTSGYLWLGVPVKKMRCLTREENEFLTYSADYYVKLAQKHKNQGELLSP